MPFKTKEKRLASWRKWYEANKSIFKIKYRPRYKNLLHLNKKAKLYRKNNPIKYKARYTLSNAIVLGQLIRPSICSECFVEGKIEGHHTDYLKPLEVIWLCKKCHTEADKKVV